MRKGRLLTSLLIHGFLSTMLIIALLLLILISRSSPKAP